MRLTQTLYRSFYSYEISETCLADVKLKMAY